MLLGVQVYLHQPHVVLSEVDLFPAEVRNLAVILITHHSLILLVRESKLSHRTLLIRISEFPIELVILIFLRDRELLSLSFTFNLRDFCFEPADFLLKLLVLLVESFCLSFPDLL